MKRQKKKIPNTGPQFFFVGEKQKHYMILG